MKALESNSSYFGKAVLCGVLGAIIILAFVRAFAKPRRIGGHGSSAQNNRQMALAAIMYASDFDNRIPPTINGWLCRMQNIKDGQRTRNCPGPGTQELEANDAAGGQRTDAWPLLELPYIKSRGLYVDPGRADDHHIFNQPAKAVGEEGYDPEGATYRNQNRFAFYAMNYMFLAPLRVPKERRNEAHLMNYAISAPHKFDEADDPSYTIFFTESQRSMSDQTRGSFVVNAPGMWKAFSDNKDGYVALSMGTLGSGDWVGTPTACADNTSPCEHPMKSSNFGYTGYNDGCNATFLDGHVKYYKAFALTAGTDYGTAIAGSQGDPESGAKIIDKKKYLWNLTDKNFYGL